MKKGIIITGPQANGKYTKAKGAFEVFFRSF